MLVRTLEGLRAEGREKLLCGGKVRAVRFLDRRDGMGFTLSDVRVAAGIDVTLWYKNHWEANYVVAGAGRVTELAGGASWALEPGLIYGVGPSDRHRMETSADTHVVSVFNPALEGDETHDADGSYPPTGPLPPGRERMFVKTRDELERMGRAKASATGNARLLRYLLKQDGLGFTWSDVHFRDGAQSRLWYKHHWEANYVLAGTGELTHHGSGEVLRLEPGVMYCVGPDDRHSLKAISGLHLVSLFNPPLDGSELHDADGSYPPTGPLPPGPGK